jgi:steroid delta-isomerase-like uncharacterized protein
MKSTRPITVMFGPFILLILLFSVGCQQRGGNTITDDDAKILMDQYMETINRADMDLIDQIISPDFVLRTPLLPEPVVGIDNYKGLVTNTSNTFSEFNATIEELVVNGDRIWGRFSMEGTNTGPLGDIPATNRSFHVEGLAVSRVADGMIVEDQTFWNVLDMYTQLGFTLVPPQ